MRELRAELVPYRRDTELTPSYVTQEMRLATLERDRDELVYYLEIGFGVASLILLGVFLARR